MGKAGRPKGINNKEEILSVRVDEETRKRLEAYCKKLQISKSEAVRNVINKVVEEELHG